MAGDGAVRLFVALELPAAVRVALARWAATTLPAAVTHARPLPEDSLHVTLCFLGARRAGEVDLIADAVRAGVTAAGTGPIALALGEPVWLPPRRARVCALALRDLSAGEDGLAVLQAALAARLAAGGWYAPERRPFLAHVSVARLPAPRRGRGPALAAPQLAPFTAAGVALLRSWPGSRYESLARVDCSGGANAVRDTRRARPSSTASRSATRKRPGPQ